MDNEFLLRYQRLTTEYAKTIKELEQAKAGIEGAIRVCGELRIMISDMAKKLIITEWHNENLEEILQRRGVQEAEEDA